MSPLTRESVASRHNQPLARSVGFTQAAAFGEFLRSARERRGLSLQQIARETKIPCRHLISLEHGDLSVIPGSTYRRGEVVAYAQVVGLDRAVALAELERLSQAPVTGDAPPPMRSRSRRRHVGIGLTVAAVLSALTLGLGVWTQEFRQVPRANAEVTSASRTSAELPHAAVDVAIASSTPAAANLQRRLDPRSQAPRKEVVSSAALVPSSPISAETRLVIITKPAGARVTVDNIGWGQTPVTIRNLPAGTKQIRVTKEGYTAAVRVARVPEGRRVTLTIPLRSVRTLPTSR